MTAVTAPSFISHRYVFVAVLGHRRHISSRASAAIGSSASHGRASQIAVAPDIHKEISATHPRSLAHPLASDVAGRQIPELDHRVKGGASSASSDSLRLGSPDERSAIRDRTRKIALPHEPRRRPDYPSLCPGLWGPHSRTRKFRRPVRRICALCLPEPDVNGETCDGIARTGGSKRFQAARA